MRSRLLSVAVAMVSSPGIAIPSAFAFDHSHLKPLLTQSAGLGDDFAKDTLLNVFRLTGRYFSFSREMFTEPARVVVPRELALRRPDIPLAIEEYLVRFAAYQRLQREQPVVLTADEATFNAALQEQATAIRLLSDDEERSALLWDAARLAPVKFEWHDRQAQTLQEATERLGEAAERAKEFSLKTLKKGEPGPIQLDPAWFAATLYGTDPVSLEAQLRAAPLPAAPLPAAPLPAAPLPAASEPAYPRLTDADRALIDPSHEDPQVREVLAQVYLGELPPPEAITRIAQRLMQLQPRLDPVDAQGVADAYVRQASSPPAMAGSARGGSRSSLSWKQFLAQAPKAIHDPKFRAALRQFDGTYDRQLSDNDRALLDHAVINDVLNQLDPDIRKAHETHVRNIFAALYLGPQGSPEEMTFYLAALGIDRALAETYVWQVTHYLTAMAGSARERRLVYFSGEGRSEGVDQIPTPEERRRLLGGKGAGLQELMVIEDIRVPASFSITTQVGIQSLQIGTYPPGLEEAVATNLHRLEEVTGRRFGDPINPLLVSVRSGAPVSMPGMMDTVLNLGLNDRTVEGLAERANNRRFALDSYRRFIESYSSVVMGVPKRSFEQVLSSVKTQVGVTQDWELNEATLAEQVIPRYKTLVREIAGRDFPTDVNEQLWGAIKAVFDSWNSKRAKEYRQSEGIPDDMGTAVTVVEMIFGNLNANSGTGVYFTRNSSTGANEPDGEFLSNAQGEDVVSGRFQTQAISAMRDTMPDVYRELLEVGRRLERKYHDMQDIELTVENGTLYILQVRNGKSTGPAKVKIAVDMAEEGLITREEALHRVQASDVIQTMSSRVDPSATVTELTKGAASSFGAVSGKPAFTPEEAVERKSRGEKVILVRHETSPEDIAGMLAAVGILTARGGSTSHAMIVAKSKQKTAIAGAGAIEINEAEGFFKVGDRVITRNDTMTLDANNNRVILGEVPTIPGEMTPELATLLQWADEIRALGVRVNADTGEEARIARRYGAQGIGLVRTEHMFFGGERLPSMRAMIMAQDDASRQAALDQLEVYQRHDFEEIFRAMDGLPVTIRLLDPPLHEFLPKRLELELHMRELRFANGDPQRITDEKLNRELEQRGVKEHPQETLERMLQEKESLLPVVKALEEFNPMLGLRGARLGILYPEISRMQARAILQAAVNVHREGVKAVPEIMIPLIFSKEELDHQKAIIEQVAQELGVTQAQIPYTIGTMIELPGGALDADRIAASAQFFSVGSNDLTQTTMGYSRDDVGKIIDRYLREGILVDDPFTTLHPKVLELIMTAVAKGRQTKPDLKIGICGEHAGDPKSIVALHQIGLDYVSPSGVSVLVARLVAAQAQLNDPRTAPSAPVAAPAPTSVPSPGAPGLTQEDIDRLIGRRWDPNSVSLDTDPSLTGTDVDVTVTPKAASSDVVSAIRVRVADVSIRKAPGASAKHVLGAILAKTLKDRDALFLYRAAKELARTKAPDLLAQASAASTSVPSQAEAIRVTIPQTIPERMTLRFALYPELLIPDEKTAEVLRPLKGVLDGAVGLTILREGAPVSFAIPGGSSLNVITLDALKEHALVLWNIPLRKGDVLVLQPIVTEANSIGVAGSFAVPAAAPAPAAPATTEEVVTGQLPLVEEAMAHLEAGARRTDLPNEQAAFTLLMSQFPDLQGESRAAKEQEVREAVGRIARGEITGEDAVKAAMRGLGVTDETVVQAVFVQLYAQGRAMAGSAREQLEWVAEQLRRIKIDVSWNVSIPPLPRYLSEQVVVHLDSGKPGDSIRMETTTAHGEKQVRDFPQPFPKRDHYSQSDKLTPEMPVETTHRVHHIYVPPGVTYKELLGWALRNSTLTKLLSSSDLDSTARELPQELAQQARYFGITTARAAPPTRYVDNPGYTLEAITELARELKPRQVLAIKQEVVEAVGRELQAERPLQAGEARLIELVRKSHPGVFQIDLTPEQRARGYILAFQFHLGPGATEARPQEQRIGERRRKPVRVSPTDEETLVETQALELLRLNRELLDAQGARQPWPADLAQRLETIRTALRLPPLSGDRVPDGRWSRQLMKAYKALLPQFEKAMADDDDARLSELNRQAQILLRERVAVQLAMVERFAAQRNRGAALAAIMGAYYTLPFLQFELLMQRYHAYKTQWLPEFDAPTLLGEVIKTVGLPGWDIKEKASGGVTIRQQRFRTRVIDGRKVRRREWVDVPSKTLAIGIRSQIHTMQSQSEDFLVVVLHIAFLRHVEVLLTLPLQQEEAARILADVAAWTRGGDVKGKVDATVELDKALTALGRGDVSLALDRIAAAKDDLKKSRLKEIRQTREFVKQRTASLINYERRIWKWIDKVEETLAESPTDLVAQESLVRRLEALLGNTPYQKVPQRVETALRRVTATRTMIEARMAGQPRAPSIRAIQDNLERVRQDLSFLWLPEPPAPRGGAGTPGPLAAGSVPTPTSAAEDLAWEALQRAAQAASFEGQDRSLKVTLRREPAGERHVDVADRLQPMTDQGVIALPLRGHQSVDITAFGGATPQEVVEAVRAKSGLPSLVQLSFSKVLPPAPGTPAQFTGGASVNWDEWEPVQGHPTQIQQTRNTSIVATWNPTTGSFDVLGGGLPAFGMPEGGNEEIAFGSTPPAAEALRRGILEDVKPETHLLAERLLDQLAQPDLSYEQSEALIGKLRTLGTTPYYPLDLVIRTYLGVVQSTQVPSLAAPPLPSVVPSQEDIAFVRSLIEREGLSTKERVEEVVRPLARARAGDPTVTVQSLLDLGIAGLDERVAVILLGLATSGLPAPAAPPIPAKKPDVPPGSPAWVFSILLNAQGPLTDAQIAQQTKRAVSTVERDLRILKRLGLLDVVTTSRVKRLQVIAWVKSEGARSVNAPGRLISILGRLGAKPSPDQITQAKSDVDLEKVYVEEVTRLAAKPISGASGVPLIRAIDELSPGRSAFVKINWDLPSLEDDTKIRQTLATIRAAFAEFGELFLNTHFGRPTAGAVTERFSMAHVVEVARPLLAEAGIDAAIVLLPFEREQIPAAIEEARRQHAGKKLLFVFENVRFYPEEKSKNPEERRAFAQWLKDVSGAEAYINEAFESEQNEQDASMELVELFTPKRRAAGFSVAEEVQKFLDFEARAGHPRLYIYGGRKFDKLGRVVKLLEGSQLQRGDAVAIVGALANPVLAHEGQSVGTSLMPQSAEDLRETQQAVPSIRPQAEQRGVTLILPQDHLVDGVEEPVTGIGEQQRAIGIGSNTLKTIIARIREIKDQRQGAIVFNGGAGVVDIARSRQATTAILLALEDAAEAGIPVFLAGGDMHQAVEIAQREDLGGRRLSDKILQTTGGGVVLEVLARGITNLNPIQALFARRPPSAPATTGEHRPQGPVAGGSGLSLLPVDSRLTSVSKTSVQPNEPLTIRGLVTLNNLDRPGATEDDLKAFGKTLMAQAVVSLKTPAGQQTPETIVALERTGVNKPHPESGFYHVTFAGSLPLPEPGSYSVSMRFSGDGGQTWLPAVDGVTKQPQVQEVVVVARVTRTQEDIEQTEAPAAPPAVSLDALSSLAPLRTGKSSEPLSPRVRVAINGFEETGKLVVRAALANPNLEVVAINNPGSDAQATALLLEYDSVYGPFQKDNVTVEKTDQGDFVVVGGRRILVLTEKDPAKAKLPWRELGVEYVIETSSDPRQAQQVARHLEAGAGKVLVAGAAQEVVAADVEIVLGANEQAYDPPHHRIISSSSPEANALVPVVQVLNGRFGIKQGTLHAVRGLREDQSAVDAGQPGVGVKRAADVNIIPTATKTAESVSKIFPALGQKVGAGRSLSVPTMGASMVEFRGSFGEAVTAEAINRAFTEAEEGTLKGIMGTSTKELVSTDFKGDPRSTIVDLPSTKVVDKEFVYVMAWQDMSAYAQRVVDLVEFLGRTDRLAAPAPAAPPKTIAGESGVPERAPEALLDKQAAFHQAFLEDLAVRVLAENIDFPGRDVVISGRSSGYFGGIGSPERTEKVRRVAEILKDFWQEPAARREAARAALTDRALEVIPLMADRALATLARLKSGTPTVDDAHLVIRALAENIDFPGRDVVISGRSSGYFGGLGSPERTEKVGRVATILENFFRSSDPRSREVAFAALTVPTIGVVPFMADRALKTIDYLSGRSFLRSSPGAAGTTAPPPGTPAKFTGGMQVDWDEWEVDPANPNLLHRKGQPSVEGRWNPTTGTFDIHGDGLPMPRGWGVWAGADAFVRRFQSVVRQLRDKGAPVTFHESADADARPEIHLTKPTDGSLESDLLWLIHYPPVFVTAATVHPATEPPYVALSVYHPQVFEMLKAAAALTPTPGTSARFTGGAKVNWAEWEPVPGRPTEIRWRDNHSVVATWNPTTGTFDVSSGGLPLSGVPADLPEAARRMAFVTDLVGGLRRSLEDRLDQPVGSSFTLAQKAEQFHLAPDAIARFLENTGTFQRSQEGWHGWPGPAYTFWVHTATGESDARLTHRFITKEEFNAQLTRLLALGREWANAIPIPVWFTGGAPVNWVVWEVDSNDLTLLRQKANPTIVAKWNATTQTYDVLGGGGLPAGAAPADAATLRQKILDSAPGKAALITPDLARLANPELSDEEAEEIIGSLVRLGASDPLGALARTYRGAILREAQAMKAGAMAEQVFALWRRSYDVPPPPDASGKSESLKMVRERVKPAYDEAVRPRLRAGEHIMISGHGNSLRALSMELFGVSPEDVQDFTFPLATPLRVRFTNEGAVSSVSIIQAGEQSRDQKNVDALKVLLTKQGITYALVIVSDAGEARVAELRSVAGWPSETAAGELLLVRHGETESSDTQLGGGFFAGWTDVSLTPQGRDDAQAAGKALAAVVGLDFRIDAAFTSDLRRAQETLSAVLGGMGVTGISPIIEPRLKERHYGALQRKPREAFMNELTGLIQTLWSQEPVLVNADARAIAERLSARWQELASSTAGGRAGAGEIEVRPDSGERGGVLALAQPDVFGVMRSAADGLSVTGLMEPVVEARPPTVYLRGGGFRRTRPQDVKVIITQVVAEGSDAFAGVGMLSGIKWATAGQDKPPQPPVGRPWDFDEMAAVINVPVEPIDATIKSIIDAYKETMSAP